MGRSYVRLVGFLLLGSGSVPLLILLASRTLLHESLAPYRVAWLIFAAILVPRIVLRLTRARFESSIEVAGCNQAFFLRSIPTKFVGYAIFSAAALSIFLEMSVIRWQASVLELFAFYKNFSLLACFVGLGLGYALSARKAVPIFLTVPLLGWQFVLLLGLRYGLSAHDRVSLKFLPFTEQLHMGLAQVDTLFSGLQVHVLLALVFLLTAAAFIPIGQLCGCLMERGEKLSAYGLNLSGSILGAVLMFVLSIFWTPPVLWFLIAFAGLLVFHAWTPRSLVFGCMSVVIALAVLAWPWDPLSQRVYSPYQLLEVRQDPRGLMLISAAGHYYQRVHDLARSNRNVDADPELSKIRDYYELPYRFYGRAPGSVVVVGAGTGNDVAAALRNRAQHVDAVEIDPAILAEGRIGHPEHPYSDGRVHAVVNDARTFLRTTDRKYDLVVYGLLDSHALLSQASSVRLDSFVYTVEALREARRTLNPDGLLSLSFSVVNPQLMLKIYLMLQSAFDGRAPVCLRAGYDGAVIFLEANDRELVLPAGLVAQSGFQDVGPSLAASPLSVDLSTDDWPFFYMPRRVYPLSYLVMGGLVLALTAFLFARFLEGRPSLGTAPFFFLGTGFMLVETKAITELGLLFGNSWLVIAVAIVAVLIMGLLANWIVQSFDLKHSSVLYVLLLISLGIGWEVSRSGAVPSGWIGRITLPMVLASPIFFSGMAFSTLLRRRGEVSGAMAANLFGAVCGGLMEYNSMYFGFRFLYILAAILYGFAWIGSRVARLGAPARA